jgi:hypothetical protein
MWTRRRFLTSSAACADGAPRMRHEHQSAQPSLSVRYRQQEETR